MFTLLPIFYSVKRMNKQTANAPACSAKMPPAFGLSDFPDSTGEYFWFTIVLQKEGIIDGVF